MAQEQGELSDVATLLAADTEARLEGIRKKVAAKEQLTKADREFLQEHGKPAEVPPETPPDVLEPVWARSQVELAQALGCGRKTVQRYLKIEGDEAPPAATSDGRYNVTLWKLWCQDHGHLEKKLSTAADRQLLEDKTIQLRNEKMAMENAIARGELMTVADCAAVIVGMFSQIVQPLRGMKHTLGPLVVGTTVPEATKRIGREVNEQLTIASQVPVWAQKKKGPAGLFWQKLSAELSGLPERFNLGDGLSET